MNYFGVSILIAWLVAVLFLLGPPNDPPSAPSGVGLCRGAPVHYVEPAPLSARLGQHSGPRVGDFNAPPWPDTGVDYTDDHEPLTDEERFSSEALGDWAWAEAACLGCTVSMGAVKEQGVGE